MLETGVGAAAMTTAMRWCLSMPRYGPVRYRPRFVLSVGFSGALQPRQRVGDLVLATEVVDPQGNCWPALVPKDFVTPEIALGRLLTVAGVVSDPAEKARLAQRYQALAADMESAVAARICHEHGVPFVCLRAISDEADTPLSPYLLDCLRDGRVAPLRLVRVLMRHPAAIRELLRLAAGTRRAAKRLRIIGSLLAGLDG